MTNDDKKVVFINGSVQLPLKIGSRATVHQNGGITLTSAVAAIRQVAEKFIVFETQNSTYCVAPYFFPDPSPVAAEVAVTVCA